MTRNPIAKAVTHLRPTVKPDRRRKLLEDAERADNDDLANETRATGQTMLPSRQKSRLHRIGYKPPPGVVYELPTDIEDMDAYIKSNIAKKANFIRPFTYDGGIIGRLLCRFGLHRFKRFPRESWCFGAVACARCLHIPADGYDDIELAERACQIQRLATQSQPENREETATDGDRK